MRPLSLPRKFAVPSVTVAALVFAGCATAGRGVVRGDPSIAPDSAAAAAIAVERGNTSGGLRTVAVPPFRISSSDETLAPLGFALADLLATDLARSAQLQLVERARLGELLREIDLARGGRVDSASAPRVGRLIRAQQLLLGALDTMPGGDLRLSVRVADVETGAIAVALDARAPLADVLAAEKAVALRLFDALGVNLSPAERALVEARPTLSIDALRAYGRGVEAVVLGDPRRATGEFERALRFDPSFVQAAQRVTEIRTAAGNVAAATSLLPAVRALDAPVRGVVDRLNRPLDMITIQSRPVGGPGDPAFPTTLVTVVIIVNRP